MKLGVAGEAFFVLDHPTTVETVESELYITSPIQGTSPQDSSTGLPSRPIPINSIHPTDNSFKAKSMEFSPIEHENWSGLSRSGLSRSANTGSKSEDILLTECPVQTQLDEESSSDLVWSWGSLPVQTDSEGKNQTEIKNNTAVDNQSEIENKKLVDSQETEIKNNTAVDNQPEIENKKLVDSQETEDKKENSQMSPEHELKIPDKPKEALPEKNQIDPPRKGYLSRILNMFSTAKNNADTLLPATDTGQEDSSSDENIQDFYMNKEDEFDVRNNGVIFDMDMENEVLSEKQNEDKKIIDVSNTDWRTKSTDESHESITPVKPTSPLGAYGVEISRCGFIYDSDFPKSTTDEVFEKLKLDYNDLTELLTHDVRKLFDGEVVFRIQGKYYPWSVAGPIMVSLLVFGENLSPKLLRRLLKENNLDGEQRRAKWYDNFISKKPLPMKKNNTSIALPVPPRLAEKSLSTPNLNSSSSISRSKNNNNNVVELSVSEQKKITPKCYKSLKPTSEQIAALNLKPGTNKIAFSITTGGGIQEVCSTIYLWEQDVSVVISDIDGTITKSDVFGQILPVVFGRDWSQDGVAQLYASIAENGYKILYLTARAIGQAGLTKGFLNSVIQEVDTLGLPLPKQVRLPDGPVFMSPDRLLNALNREVIIRRPEEFKIACLDDIKSLFGNSNPFYAGFGNRDSDAKSYKEIGIPVSKIFLINVYGEVSCYSGAYSKTYTKLHELVDEMFPPLNPKVVRTDAVWNDWNYWKADRVAQNLEDIEKLL